MASVVVSAAPAHGILAAPARSQDSPIGGATYVHVGPPQVIDVRSLPAAQPSQPVLEQDQQEEQSAAPIAAPRRDGVIVMRQQPLASGPVSSAPARVAGVSPSSAYSFAAGSYVEEQQYTAASAPPDTQIAVGPGANGSEVVLEMVNSTAFFYNQFGVPLAPYRLDLNAFFGTDASYPTETDARVLYDAESGRFFASAELFNGSTNNGEVALAVSKSADPTAGWLVYHIAASSFGLKYDQPKLGISSDKIVLSWTEYNSAQNPVGTAWEVLQKSDAMAGAGLGGVTFTSGNASQWLGLASVQSLQPSSTAYAVYANGNQLGVIFISGTPDAGTVSAYEVDLPLSSYWVTPTAVRQPGSAQGSAPYLDVQGLPVQSAIWKDNMIWVAGTDSCLGAGILGCMRVVQVSTAGGNASLVQDQDLSAAGTNLVDPAVMLDGNDNLFVTFSESSDTQYAAAGLAVIPGGYITPDVTFSTYAAGNNTYNDGYGSSASRWGDYAGAAPDPTNPQNVWLAAEYGAVSASGNSPDWVTQLGAFSFTTPAVTGLSPASGPAISATCNPLVTVSGANFDSSATVRFGTVAAASVAVISPTQLQAQAPQQAAGTVDVSVATASGGTSATTSADLYTYAADGTPPTTTATLSPAPNANGWEHGTVQVTLNATDDACGSGVKATYYALDGGAQQTYSGPLSVSAEGRHTLTFFSVDNAGNVEATHSSAVNVDLTPPHTTASISATSNGCGGYFSPVTVTLSANDNLSGVAITVYQVDGGSTHTYQAPFTLAVSGHRTVSFHSADAAGNVESTQTASFVIVGAAALARSPSSGGYLGTVAITGTNFTAGEGIKVYWDSTAASPISTTTASASCSFGDRFSVPQAISGTHTIIAVGQSSGRSASATFRVTPKTFLSHSSGKAGTQTLVTGDGFAAHETVATYWQSRSGRLLGTATTYSTGTFNGAHGLTATIPLSPTGTYNIVSVGLSSGGVYTRTFTITP